VEPTNNETPKQDIARNERETKASGPPIPTPMLVFCGGAAIKALYSKNNQNGGRSQK